MTRKHLWLTCYLQEGAGSALCDQLHTTSSGDTAAGVDGKQLELQLLQEILLRAPDAHWARVRLGRLQLELGRYQEAVTAYQAAIR